MKTSELSMVYNIPYFARLTLRWDFYMMIENQAIREAFNWGLGYYLRKLFVTMLISNNINKLEHVWEQTWNCLVDGILHD